MTATVTRRSPLVMGAAALGVALVALPLVALAGRADWSQVVTDLQSPAALEAMRLSLLTSLTATGIAVALGLPLAWVLARGGLRFTSVLRALVLLPMVLPPVVGGVALLAAFSRRSVLGGLLHRQLGITFTFSPAGVVLAQTFVALPFFVITVEAALRSTDQRLEHLAASLGAAPRTVFRQITLPLIAPSVAAGAVLAWARAIGEFGATITFAGSIEGRTQTLPLAVYQALETDPGAAISLSLVLLGVSLVVLVGLRNRWLGRP